MLEQEQERDRRQHAGDPERDQCRGLDVVREQPDGGDPEQPAGRRRRNQRSRSSHDRLDLVSKSVSAHGDPCPASRHTIGRAARVLEGRSVGAWTRARMPARSAGAARRSRARHPRRPRRRSTSSSSSMLEPIAPAVRRASSWARCSRWRELGHGVEQVAERASLDSRRARHGRGRRRRAPPRRAADAPPRSRRRSPARARGRAARRSRRRGTRESAGRGDAGRHPRRSRTRSRRPPGRPTAPRSSRSRSSPARPARGRRRRPRAPNRAPRRRRAAR